MSLADFNWLSDQLREELQQDLLGRGEPLTVEAQVAAGLYRLGHGASHITIGGGFIDIVGSGPGRPDSSSSWPLWEGAARDPQDACARITTPPHRP